MLECMEILVTETLNKHAPIRHKRTRRNSVPWINPSIKDLMRNRDYHKKLAIKYASQTQWESFRKLRNEVNIQMRNATSRFVHDKINDCSKSNDPKKAWTVSSTHYWGWTTKRIFWASSQLPPFSLIRDFGKQKHPRKRFQNFRQSYVLSTDRIEIHQSQLEILQSWDNTLTGS